MEFHIEYEILDECIEISYDNTLDLKVWINSAGDIMYSGFDDVEEEEIANALLAFCKKLLKAQK